MRARESVHNKTNQKIKESKRKIGVTVSAVCFPMKLMLAIRFLASAQRVLSLNGSID